MVRGGLAALGAAAASAPIDADAELLAIARAVSRAAEDEARACRAHDLAEAADADRLEAAARRAFDAWCDRVREMAAVPAKGATGLAVKAALIVQGFREGRTEATAALAASLEADIARIAPSVIELMA
jgi:hypothetical protein